MIQASLNRVLTYLTLLALLTVYVVGTKLTDTGRSGSGVYDFLSTILPDTDIGLLILVLLSNEGRDVRLETSGTNTHDN
jgi:hypothetical protein